MRPSILLIIAVLLVATPARATSGCEEATPWITSCSEQSGLELAVRACPKDRLIIGIPRVKLDVELSTGGLPAARRIGSVGVSPVGSFPDWGAEKERRAAFDAIADCVRADPAVPFATGKPPPKSKFRPWILGAAIALALALAVVRKKSLRSFALALAAFVAVTFAVWYSRRLLVPFAFFHQNGVGPVWIGAALDTTPRVSEYGPGFRELFSFASHATGSRPERGVFLLASVIGATIPALAFLTARAVGVTRAVAGAVFLCLWIDPSLIRTAHSESYFSVIVALLLAAAWALACGSWRTNVKSPVFVLGVLAAGLFIAQAAHVHPIAWVPATLVPLVVLLGTTRRRVLLCGVSALGIAAVVLVATGPALWATLSGTLGEKWLQKSHPRWDVVADHLPVLVSAALAGFVLRGRRGARVAFVLVVGVALGKLTDLVNEPNLAVVAASNRLLLPVVLPAIAVWFHGMSRRKTEHAAFLPLVLALVGVALAAKAWSSATERYTDAREAGFALEWRERLPAGAEVVYMERAGQRTLRLPLYDGVTASSRNLSTRDPIPDLSGFSGRIYYYRSSLCSTEEAASACQKLEASASLELVAERELPAIPSMRWNPYPVSSVRVALYRRP